MSIQFLDDGFVFTPTLSNAQVSGICNKYPADSPQLAIVMLS